jgi:hypothetical protein
MKKMTSKTTARKVAKPKAKPAVKNPPIETRLENILKHALGCSDQTPRQKWGYRNGYCAAVGADPHDACKEMVTFGWMTPGGFEGAGESQYFHVTLKGMVRLGLSEDVIQRALGD